MKNGYKSVVLLVVLIIVLTGCKNEFEKVKLSNDPELMYTKADEYFDDEQYERAQVLYELAITAYRGKKEAEELFYKYALSHFYLEQYILAAHYFKNFANTFINSDKREEAEYMAAYSNYKNSPSFRLDQEYTREAIEGFQLYVNTYPLSERVDQCNELIDELRSKLERKMFEQAKLYYDLEEYQSATQTFINVLQEYPESQNAEEIRYLIVKSAYRLARNSIYSKRKERYEDAIELGNRFKDRYPRSTYTREIQSMISASGEAIKSL